MLIFITGATGLIGRRLVLNRLERGDQVIILSRNGDKAARQFAADANPNVQVVEGDAAIPGDWQKSIDGCDAVIHLAGAGIADKRWTDEYKKTIINSRIDSTHQVVNAIRDAASPPGILLSGSAIGIYGDTGNRETDESGATGSGFLPDLCKRWEQQAIEAELLGCRVVLLRTAVVLDDRGGALTDMMLPFNFFAGGKLGSGKQWMSWIHYRDMIGLINLALMNDELNGPLNCTSPGAVRNKEFMKLLSRELGRPAWLPAPKFGLRIVLGEFASFLLQSQRIVPEKALELGHHFLFPDLEYALESLVADYQRRQGNRQPSLEEGFHSSEVDDLPPYPSIATAASEEIVEHPQEAIAHHRPKRERPLKKIRLVAIDIDGTMLRSDGRLPQAVLDSCRAAARNDCLIVPATARPPRSMQSIVQTLGVTGPTINYNGAVIWNPTQHAAQYHEALEPGLVRQIIDDARELRPEIVVSIEILDKWYTDRVDPGLHTETSRVFDPDYVGSLDTFLNQPVTKLMLLAPHAELSPVHELIRERYWSQKHIAVFITDPHVIQIAHPMVDKAIALQRIASRMNIDVDEVMAIGDGPNDAGMIEWAGFGVAVENACDICRQLADVVVPSNNENGVAKAIQRYVLST